jgi:periplasmic protein TonB
MAYVESDGMIDRLDLVRWSIAAAVMLALHALAAFVLSQHSDQSDAEAGAPVVTVELAPMAVAPPAPPTDYAPGPQQLQAATPEQAEEMKPEQKDPDPIKPPDVTPAPNPEVALPPPEPPKEHAEERVKVEPQEQAAVPTAPPTAVAPAPQPAAPAPGEVARPTSAAVASWQRSLVAYLERHKRFPPEAGHEQRVVMLGFTIDRAGHVLTSRIVRSSGSAVLDRETLAMIKRAEPLPRPPGDLRDDQLSFQIPVKYYE